VPFPLLSPGVIVLTRASGYGGKSVNRFEQEPAEPDALALSADADPVHAVVPVAAEDQRQAALRTGAL
jgi:hypothetical protein